MTCSDVKVTNRPAGNCSGGSDQGGKQTERDSVGINRRGGVSSEGWRIQWEAVPPGQKSGTL